MNHVEKKENKVINVMKFFVILYVVAGHCINQANLISKIIYLINLPLFFIVSGYFFKDGEYKNPKEIFLYLGNKIGRFWKYYFIYGTLLVLVHNVFYHVGIIDVSIYKLYDIKDFIFGIFNAAQFISLEPFSSAMWFIPVLIIGLTIFYAICYYSSKSKHSEFIKFLLVLLTFAVGYYLTYKDINIGLHYNISFYIIPFIYIGYIMKKINIADRIKSFNKWQLLFISLISLIILVLIIKFVPGRPDIANNILWNPIFYYVCAILLFYLTYLLSNFIVKSSSNVVVNLLNYIGKHTISIMCLHIAFIKLVDFVFIHFMTKNYALLPKFVFSYSKLFPVYVVIGIMGPILLELTFLKIYNLFYKKMHNKECIS